MGVIFALVAMNRRQRIFDADTFVKEVQKRWPTCRIFVNRGIDAKEDVWADIDAADSVNAATYTISHSPNNRIITINGGPFNSAEVAAWVRNLYPDPDLALWFIDQSFSSHVVLYPGITTEEIHAGWVDHREHDPYEEYPQYFPME